MKPPPSDMTPDQRSSATVRTPSTGGVSQPSPAILDPALEAALLRPPGSGENTDRYLHVGILASGGSGVVHAVEDRVLQRTIAVKRLHDTLRTEVGIAFLREAQTLARLDHPGIIPVYDYGVDSGYHPYIVMKRVEGEDFSSWLRAVGAPTSRDRQVRVLDIIRRVCDAIAFAHTRGILHNDLKPGNLMLGDHGEVYVVDWGNAVPRRRWKRGLRAMSGTPAYMSPEQARGEPLSPRTDIFGLGACLYTLLVGTSPRSRNAMQAIKEATERHKINPPDGHRVPTGLMDLLLRCMHPDPDARPATVRELAREIDRARLGTWMAPRITVQPGEDVVRQGDEGDQAYVVEDGQLEVIQDGTRVRVMGPGEVFGELAPLTRCVRTSTVRALTPCALAVIDGAQLRQSLDMGNLGGRFVAALAQRLLDRERPSADIAPADGFWTD